MADPATAAGGVGLALGGTQAAFGVKAARQEAVTADAIGRYNQRVEHAKGVRQFRNRVEEAKEMRRRTRRTESTLIASGAPLAALEAASTNAALDQYFLGVIANQERSDFKASADLAFIQGRQGKKAANTRVVTSLLDGINTAAQFSLSGRG